MDTQFKLGDHVKVQAIIVPRKTSWPIKRQWRRIEGEKHGMICGIRTVQEGTSENQGEDGFSFRPEKYIRTYLVALNMRSIVHVLPEDVVEKEEEIVLFNSKEAYRLMWL